MHTTHIPAQLQHVAHVVVLLDNVIAEYASGLSQEYAKGIYCFDTKHKAETFTSLCNSLTVIGDDIAYHFENPAMTPKRNRKEKT